jgi:uncharacterized protein YjiS (DUF1127 family)
MSVTMQRPQTNCQGTRPPHGLDRVRLIGILGRMIRLWRSRIRERRTLVSFDDRDLRDLGMSRWDAERELSKPFWRG